MHKLLLFMVLGLFAQASFANNLTLSKNIYKDVPFSSQFLEDGALIRNIDYASVKKLIPQLNKIYSLDLQGRGEAHITVITPPEAQGWFSPDHKGINYLISSKEIHQKYFSTLQKTKFKVSCVGRQKNKKGNIVFYLVIESPDLKKVRQDIQKELELRAKFTGKKVYFDALNYDPHITIGFIGGDIHGVSKGIETCVKNVSVK